MSFVLRSDALASVHHASVVARAAAHVQSEQALPDAVPAAIPSAALPDESARAQTSVEVVCPWRRASLSAPDPDVSNRSVFAFSSCSQAAGAGS